MSYLHTPRLVFTGDFLSDVSTVNNDPAKYNNDTFQPNFQIPGKGSANGWWNPEGGAIFNLQDCSIKQAVYKDGTSVEASDDLIGQFVKCAEGRASGKMVDLDPQMQMVSQLWGIKLRITNKAGDLLLLGDLTTTGFRDLQKRQTAGAHINGQALGGSWPTTLTNVVWGGAASKNRFMSELMATTEHNKLSVNLNGFGYYYAHASNGRFSMGRMVGAIGPWFDGEPETMSPSRKLYGIATVGQSVYFKSTNFILNSDKVTFDFGQSFPISNSLGRIDFSQHLIAAVSHKALTNQPAAPITIPEGDFTILNKITYETGDNWLMDTGGIVSIDINADGVEKLKDNQLLLLTINASGEYVVLAREAIEGYVLKADNFVQRIDADQSSFVRFYAWKWGIPMPKGDIKISLQAPTAMTPISSGNPIYFVPGNNYPPEGIRFEKTVKTDENGIAEMKLTGNHIDQPRDYLPGQLYFLDYALANVDSENTSGLIPDMVNVHLRSYFKIPEKPVWEDIAYEMTQFSNLYPIMSKYFIDLSDPHALIANKEILTFAFTRDITDPLYMPVTRDLSDAKRLTILKWLQNPLITEEGKDKEILKLNRKEEELKSDSAMLAIEATAIQIKLKKLTEAKNGTMQDFQELKSLNY
jgi:hypothetical protein